MRNTVKARVLSLALFVVLLQATLPFFTICCPFYQSVHSASTMRMPADCPMAGMPTSGHAASDTPDKPAKTHGVAFCPLCQVMSPLHGYVAAGLIALPPPAALSTLAFAANDSSSAPATRAAYFSARGPPSAV